MNYHGTIKIRASVSDSRGRWSDTKEVSVTVLEYFAPALSFSIARTGSTSSTLTATRNAKIAPLTVSGSQKNTMTLTFKVARLGTTNFQVDTGPATGSWTSISNLVNSQANLAGNYLANQSWVVIGTLEDKFTRTDFMVNVATESVVLSYDRSGIGVNKIRERGALDVKGDIYVDDKPIQQYQLTNNDSSLSKNSAQWDDVWNKQGTEFGWRNGKYADNPTGNDWGLFQNYWLDSWKGVQFFTGVSSNRFFFRSYNNNTEWKPSQWKEVATKDDIQSHTQGTDWQNLPLQNGWQRHQQHNDVQYSKSFDGVVFLRGVGTKGKTAYGTVIAQLPVGFRPLHSTYVFALNDDFTVAVLCILTSGEIVVKNNVDNTWLNFDNISFKI
jgi:orf22